MAEVDEQMIFEMGYNAGFKNGINMIKDIDKIQVYLDCHEGFVDEYISKTKLMRIVDKYFGKEIKDENNN